MMMASSEICTYDPRNWNCSFHTSISASCVHKPLLKVMVCVPLWPGQEMQFLWAQVEGMFFIQRLAFALHGDCPYRSPIFVLLDLGKQTLLLNILRYICSTKRNIPLNRISWYQCQQNPFSWFNAADNRWVTNMWMLNIITQPKTFNTNSWEEQDLVFCVTWFVLETKTIVKTNP